GDSASFLDQGRVTPYTQQFQLGVQRTLPGRIKLEAAFLRVLSRKGLDNFDLNEKPDQYLALGAADTISQRQLWLAYPQFTNVTKQASSTHMASDNALQLSVEKRLDHGLT